MEVFINGEKVGYERVSFQREGDQILTRTRSHMKMGREEALIVMDTVSVIREKTDGTPLSIHNMTREGVLLTKMDITFEGNDAVITRNTGGRTWDHTVQLDPGFVVSWGVLRELVDLVQSGPGSSVESRIYVPDMTPNTALPSTTTFLGEETIDIRGKGVETFKLEQTIEMGPFPLTGTIWLKPSGETAKGVFPLGGMVITMISATEEQAKGQFEPNDIFTSSLIPLNGPVPFDKESVTYRLTTSEKVGSPIRESLNQTVVREDENHYKVIVQRGSLTEDLRSDNGVERRYIEPSRLVDYEDPAIQALLPSGIDDLSFPGKLEALVGATDSAIATKSLDFGFATASEAAQESEGDCTEHALLLAALARAAGIPSRGATGLVGFYNESGEPMMGYHMWTQVWNGEVWLDLDAAYGEAETSPIRILLGVNDLTETDPISDLIMMAEFMGRTEIEIIETTEPSRE